MTRYILALLVFLLLPVAQASADDVFDAIRKGDDAAMRHYITNKGDLEAQTGRGYTPFILAAYHGKNTILQSLLAAGAKPCAEDKTGNNAYMGVAFRGHTETTQWLLQHTKCDVNHQNHAGQTALMMASLFGREAIIELLLAAGAKPDIVDQQGNSARALAQAQGLEKIVKRLTFPLQ
jgi:ankyrin repeat protein